MNIAQIRQQYPQYNDLSDMQLADALHKKYYSDLPKEQVYRKLGVESAPQEKENVHSLSNILKLAGHFGAGALQGAARAGQGLGELETSAVNKLFGTTLKSPEADVYGAFNVKPDIATKAGEIVSGGLTTAAAPESLELKLAPKLASYFASGFATTPGETGERIKGGLESELIPAIGAAPKAIKNAAPEIAKVIKKPGEHLFSGKLAKALEERHANVKTEANELYNKAFENTDLFKPSISTKSIDLTREYLKDNEGKAAFTRHLDKLKQSPTPKALHNFKSAVKQEMRDLQDKKIAQTLTPNEKDDLFRLKELNSSLENDLENTMKKIGKDKYADYLEAQRYYKENKAPFEQFKSVRQLLGSERKVDKQLLKDLGLDQKSAEALRKQLELSKGGLKSAKHLGLGALGVIGADKILKTLGIL